jgi:dipeptide/tripeptide permease
MNDQQTAEATATVALGTQSLEAIEQQKRSSLTQTMISDFAKEEHADAAFSIYYFIGCISGPIWTLIVGYVMERYGFTHAFYVAASTYIAGMLLLLLVKEAVAKSEK